MENLSWEQRAYLVLIAYWFADGVMYILADQDVTAIVSVIMLAINAAMFRLTFSDKEE